MSDVGVQPFVSVWDALEDSPELAVSLRLRSNLLHGIVSSIETWDMARAQVESRLGLTPSRLDDILQGRIDVLSLDELVAVASRAGMTIRVETVASAA